MRLVKNYEVFRTKKYPIPMATKQRSKNRIINPIPDLETVDPLRQALRSKPRDLLLFDLATQTSRPYPVPDL